MKKTTSFSILILLLLILSGCQEKVGTKSTTTTNCNLNYYAYGCPGYNQYGTTTGTTGTSCTGNDYYYTQGCQGFCSTYPTHSSCTGTTTSGTSGGTVNCSALPIPKTCPKYCQVYTGAYGCLADGTNCFANPTASGCAGSSSTVNPNWGVHYPGGIPAGSCSAAYVASGSSGSLATRKATMTIAGGRFYNPISSEAASYLNTSSMLKTLAGASTFFRTDSGLKVRFKAKPQPEAAQTSTMCYGRNMPASTIPGYTKLQFNVTLRGVYKSNGVLKYGVEEPLGIFTVGVNACTEAIDLSSYSAVWPEGVILIVSEVKANQNCSSWASGFNNCNLFKQVRTFDCWSMDVEVAAPETLTFD